MILVGLALAATCSAGVPAASDVVLEGCLVSGSVKIFPDYDLGPDPAARVFRITAVRNEYEPFQLVIRAEKPVKGVTVAFDKAISETGIVDHPASRTFLVETVAVETSSIPNRGTGADKPFPRPWPDPLPPLKTFQVEANQTRAVWIDLFIPADASPGLYKGAVLVTADHAVPIRLPFELDVHDITIPTPPSVRTAVGNSALPVCLEKAHGAYKGSPLYHKLREEYYWLLVEHRLSPYHVPVDIFSDDAHRFLDDPRVTSFVVPIEGGIGKKGALWDDAQMKRLSDRLERTGWVKKGIVYLIDEPSPAVIPDVIAVGKRIHAINPRFKYLMTPHSGHLLSNKGVMEHAGIDIWAPLLTVLSSPKERKVLLQQQQRGAGLWWYTCVVPKWKGMNYFIDEAATAPRIHPWMNHLYGVEGILYWATDNWTEVGCDPWRKTETYPTGNGDGSLLYPGRDGFDHPVASIRLKMLREGLEDYELLKLLADRLKRAAVGIGGAALRYGPEQRLFEHAFALITDEGRSQTSGEDTAYLQYVTRDHRDIERQRNMVIHEMEQALQPPLLLVETVPCDRGYTSAGDATITGYAETGSVVEVNGVSVELKENGFQAAVPLSPGPNIISVKAKSRTGKSKIFRRTVYRR